MLSTKYDQIEKLWYGADIPPLYNARISLAQAMLNSMKIFGSKTAQICDDTGTQMSFAEVRSKTIQAAITLQTLGYEQKEVFGIVARSSHLVTPIILASIAIGCPVSTLDPSLGKNELINMLRITKPVLMFCDATSYELVKKCLNELGNAAKIFTFDESVDGSEPVENLFKGNHNENFFSPANVDGPNETVLFVCTSGTTGTSKVARWSHAAILDEVCQFTGLLSSDDVILCFGVLFLAHSLVILLRGILGGETRVFTTNYFSPADQFRMIEKYNVTFTVNAPFQIALMMKSDRLNEANFSSMKYAMVGGGSIPLNMKNELKKHLPNGSVIATYGMSELSGPMTIDYPPSYDKSTVGRLVSGSCVKIIDEHGSRCGINEQGEICIKMKYKFLGYYGNQQATEDIFDEEGFILTGDIGYFDEDGDFYVCGRKKDVLKYSGYHISPHELDMYLIESPCIEAVCVVGIPDLMGDLPAAVVVRAKDSKITEKDIYDMVADNFADQCKLRGGVYFVDSMPTTSSDKLLRRKVRDIAVELYNQRKR